MKYHLRFKWCSDFSDETGLKSRTRKTLALCQKLRDENTVCLASIILDFEGDISERSGTWHLTGFFLKPVLPVNNEDCGGFQHFSKECTVQNLLIAHLNSFSSALLVCNCTVPTHNQSNFSVVWRLFLAKKTSHQRGRQVTPVTEITRTDQSIEGNEAWI